mgnify:CR=1 FL=1
MPKENNRGKWEEEFDKFRHGIPVVLRDHENHWEDITPAIKDFIEKKGFAPSHFEIANHFGIEVGGSSLFRLSSIEKKGYIKRKKHFLTPYL